MKLIQEQINIINDLKQWLTLKSTCACDTCFYNPQVCGYRLCGATGVYCPKYAPPGMRTVGGYAGTGKTTLIKELISQIGSMCDSDKNRFLVSVAAYTGKAASVLRKKGVSDASTIHQLIYIYDPHVDRFFLRTSIPADVIIIDEASMVSASILKGLCSFKKPIIFVGDIGQLPPVICEESKDKDPRLLRHLDHRLRTIHRQNQRSGIVGLAYGFRKGVPKSQWTDAPGVRLGDVKLFQQSMLNLKSFGNGNIDQIICGTNKWRTNINKVVLSTLYKNGKRSRKDGLEAGDRIMCLVNNHRVGVFNGLIATVKFAISVSKTEYIANLVDEEGIEYKDILIDKKQFGKQKQEAKKDEEAMGRWRKNKRLTFWDYGWCITCHKAQGSEWDSVLVYEDYPGDWKSAPRWRYTAATRARRKLIYCW